VLKCTLPSYKIKIGKVVLGRRQTYGDEKEKKKEKNKSDGDDEILVRQ
jgi:hypothetical protein